MLMFICGVMVGFSLGYPLGLFIDKLDKKEKVKNDRR